jgi:O-antigen/teichoic acid export membrane protein
MSLRNKAISGAKWTSISKIVIAVVALIKVSVLARYLSSDDFGLMALTMFVLGFMNLFMDMGLTSAILHKQGISDSEYSSLYWINIIFSAILFLFISLLSPLIGKFYEEPLLGGLIILMASSLIINAVGRQFRTIEQKELNFKFISKVDIVGAILSLLIAILLAVNNYGVYALVYSALIQYAITTCVYFYFGVSKRKLKWHLKLSETKPFFKIGMYQVGGQIINYFNRDIDILLIGKFFGSDILGGYSLAKQLVSRPMAILNPVITNVASPVLSILQNEKTELKNKYLSFLNLISTANISAYGLLAIFAYPAVLIFYGQDYLELVTIVQILCAYMYLRSISSPVGSLLVATGRTDYGFYWNILVLFSLPPVVYLGSLFSIEVIAICLVGIMLLLTVLAWKFIVFKLINVGFKTYFWYIIPNWSRVIDIIKKEYIKK